MPRRNFYYLRAIIILIVGFCSCKRLIAKAYGVKKPRPTTDSMAVHYLDHSDVDYDFVLRLNKNTGIKTLSKDYQVASNSIVLYDDKGNELGNTNDSTCHYSLRSQITKIISANADAIRFSKRNIKDFLNDSTHCLSCGSMNSKLFDRPLKKYVLLFSYARFIPLRGKKLSDLDYLDELKSLGLRDRVSVILLNKDLQADGM